MDAIALERIWAFHAGPMVGLHVGKSPGVGVNVAEYVRADIHAAALDKIERLEKALDIDKAVHAAAVKWCGEKYRETSQGGIDYFIHNWKSLSGLRDYVLREIGRAAATGGEVGR